MGVRFPCHRPQACDGCRYIALLRKALDPSDAGKGLYFSRTADLTLTQQRAAELEEQDGREDAPFTRRTEQRFFWNRHLLAPFLGERDPLCKLWAVLVDHHSCVTSQQHGRVWRRPTVLATQPCGNSI